MNLGRGGGRHDHSISDAGITNAGAEALLAVLPSCPSMLYLTCDKNSIDAELMAKIQAAIKVNEEPGRKQLGTCFVRARCHAAVA